MCELRKESQLDDAMCTIALHTQVVEFLAATEESPSHGVSAIDVSIDESISFSAARIHGVWPLSEVLRCG